MMAAHVVEGLPAAKRAALSADMKSPLVYVMAAIGNWSAFAALKTHESYAPGSFFCRVRPDYSVSMGGYACPQDPSTRCSSISCIFRRRPTASTIRATPCGPGARTGSTSPWGISKPRCVQLQRMLGAGGFDAERDIAAITINRWSHGYSDCANCLVDDEDEAESLVETADAPFGRIGFAGADRDRDPCLHAAIDAAARAVDAVPES